MAQSLEYRKHWYPYILLTEEERAREMLEMLRPDIACVVKNSDKLTTTMADCFGRAFRAKYRLAQIQEEKAKEIKVSERLGKRKNNFSTSRIIQFQGKRKKLATTLGCRKCG